MSAKVASRTREPVALSRYTARAHTLRSGDEWVERAGSSARVRSRLKDQRCAGGVVPEHVASAAGWFCVQPRIARGPGGGGSLATVPRDIAPPVSSFEALPARIYLDTFTLHRLFDYGDVIWEDAPFVPSQHARSVPGLAAELDVYFFCLGRQQRRTTCLRKAVSVELIEEKVEELWDAVHVSPEYSDLLDELIRGELAVYREQAERTRASATRRLELLQGQRRKLLDAHYAGAIPIELLKSEQDRLTEEVAACERRLATAGTTTEAIEQNLDRCLQFIQDAATSYRTAPARIRRRMNQALFERIMVEEDGTVIGQLAGPYRQLLDPPWSSQRVSSRTNPTSTKSQHCRNRKPSSTPKPGASVYQPGCTPSTPGRDDTPKSPRHPTMSEAHPADPARLILRPGV